MTLPPALSANVTVIKLEVLKEMLCLAPPAAVASISWERD
jgi:hypothetical protein